MGIDDEVKTGKINIIIIVISSYITMLKSPFFFL